jgi:hypothetical protein
VLGRFASIVSAGLVAVSSCKKEEQEPVVYYPPPPAPATAAPTVPTPATPPPPAPNPNLHPAVGFPCTTDADPFCPFGRCLGGRCGGCSDASQCKPGISCLPTWFGNACVPGSAQQPAPAPQPTVAQPAPAPTVVAPVPAPAPQGDGLAPLRARCVQRINEHRARVGVAALGQRTDKEPCADAQAQSDAASRRAHGAFGQCRESSQNECPGWPDALEVVVDRCLAMMFAEGPGSGPEHGHYVNMTDPQVRGVACGIARGANGEVWIVHDYFR